MAAKPGLQPLFSYVLIKSLPPQEKTASGIILPSNAQEKPQMGEVVATGEGFGSEDGRENKMIVKVGDKVIYKKWGGNEVKYEGVEYLLVEQKDIMAVMK